MSDRRLRSPLVRPVLYAALTCLVVGPLAAQPAAERPKGRFLGTFGVTAHPIEVLDANPLFTGKPFAELSAREVGALDIHAAGRVGTVADGVSRLLLRVRVAGNATLDCAVEGGDANGTCRALAVRPSPPVAGTTVAVAIYQPPKTFGPGAGATPQKYRGEVEARDVVLRLSLKPGSGPTQIASKRVLLARPPVILVHGTFDEPTIWSTGEGGQAFAPTVEAAGFRTFAVDYAGDFLSNVNNNQGSFEDNRMTVWERPDGIRDALDFFRRDLNLAAARVDMVGHSLGGLLARVYASPKYESAGHPYKRPDNFGEGDIARLLTLCTPHHGSAISAMLATLHKAEISRTGAYAAALATLTIAMSEWWEGVRTDRGAVRDQLPGSEALKRIGSTPIPAFAIGCIAGDDDVNDIAVDPNNTYRKRVDNLSWLFYQAPTLLEEYLKANGMEREALQVPWLLDTIYRYWLKKSAEVGWLTAPPDLDGEESPARVAALQAVFRSFLFLYDENDYTVGLASQHGGLGPKNRIDLRGILHGPAPRYWTLQKRVIDVLKGQSPGGETFAEAGFPAAGDDPKPVPPPKTLIEKLASIANTSPPPGDPRDQVLTLVDLIDSDAFVRGEEAIRRSGMVYAHALKFMAFAERSKSVFMFRPVNPDSTLLIAGNASTKPMAIKAKSSDWGPHRGLLPVDQAFSKKADASAETIAKFNCDAYDNLAESSGASARTGVKAVPLTVEQNGKRYEVVRTAKSSGELADYRCTMSAEKKKHVPTGDYPDYLAGRIAVGSRQPLLLRTTGADGKTEYLVAEGAPAPTQMPPAATLPFTVFADKNGKYMTADYDTLAIASRDRECHAPDFHPVYGGACNWQIDLIRQLNSVASSGECKYDGGDLVHHGPETNYTGSEYIDYPILAFIPRVGDEASRIVAIRQGPAGFRDMHTKRLFFMLQQQGWKIDPNPNKVGWNWGVQNVFTGYDLADQVKISADAPDEIVAKGPLQKPCVPASLARQAVAR